MTSSDSRVQIFRDSKVLFEIPNGRAIGATYEILGCLIKLPMVQDDFRWSVQSLMESLPICQCVPWCSTSIECGSSICWGMHLFHCSPP